MKHGNMVIALLIAFAFLTGYPVVGDESIEKVKKETKETAASVKDYAYAEKTEFIAKMKSELAEINVQIDKLSKKAEKAGDAAKAEAKVKIQALRDQAAKLSKQLDEANDVAEAKWDDFKSGFKKSCDDMKDAFRQSRHWLSEKIAP